MKWSVLLCFVFLGCSKPISEIKNCVGTYQVEANGGTMTTIIEDSDKGLVHHGRYRGVYVCSEDGTVNFVEVGNVREMHTLGVWTKVNNGGE